MCEARNSRSAKRLRGREATLPSACSTMATLTGVTAPPLARQLVVLHGHLQQRVVVVACQRHGDEESRTESRGPGQEADQQWIEPSQCQAARHHSIRERTTMGARVRAPGVVQEESAHSRSGVADRPCGRCWSGGRRLLIARHSCEARTLQSPGLVGPAARQSLTSARAPTSDAGKTWENVGTWERAERLTSMACVCRFERAAAVCSVLQERPRSMAGDEPIMTRVHSTPQQAATKAAAAAAWQQQRRWR
jgi:hypothetical protein